MYAKNTRKVAKPVYSTNTVNTKKSTTWSQQETSKCKFGVDCKNHPERNTDRKCEFAHPPLPRVTQPFQVSPSSKSSTWSQSAQQCKYGVNCKNHPERNNATICRFSHPPLSEDVHNKNQKVVMAKIGAVFKDKHSEEIVTECLKIGNSEDQQMVVFITLIKLITTLEQVRDILAKLPTPSHVKKTQKAGYTPYNILAFKRVCDHQVFSAIANLIHERGFSVAEKNDEGESALDAVLANTSITEEERNFRYMVIANVHDSQIKKLLNKVFTGIIADSDNKEYMNYVDYVRHALCINSKLALDIIAKFIITRSIPADCNEKDKNASDFIDFISLCFTGAVFSFKRVSSSKTFNLFFKLNTNKVPTENQLFTQLIESGKEYALTSTHEYKDIELEAFGFLIGIIASKNILTDTYKQLVLDFLKPEATFSNIEPKIRAKMAIRAVVHGDIKTSEITTAFREFPEVDGKISTSIKLLLGEIRPNRKIAITQTKPVSELKEYIIKIEDIRFFKGLNSKNVDVVITTTIKDLDTTLIQHSTQRSEVVKQLISCLLENSNTCVVERVANIMSLIKAYVSFEEIKLQSVYFEELLADISDDCPLAPKVWEGIVECL